MTRMPAPRCSRIFRDSVTSEIWGMFSIRQTPSTSSAAGMMATAAFLAPLISTSPNRGWPPCTIYFVKVNTLSSKGAFFCGGTRVFYKTVCPACTASYPKKTSETGRIFRREEAHTSKLYHTRTENANPSCKAPGGGGKIRQNSERIACRGLLPAGESAGKRDFHGKNLAVVSPGALSIRQRQSRCSNLHNSLRYP